VTETDTGRLVRTATGEAVYADSDGRYYSAYKGRKLDLSVLASILLFELTTRTNPYAGCTFPAILTDIMNGARLDVRAYVREHPHSIHPQIQHRPSFLAHIDAIIRKGSAAERRQTYSSARELAGDLDRAIKSCWGAVPDAGVAAETMGSLLGKTLVDEYEHVLRRLERSIRSGTFGEDRDNPARIALLYKLKKTDRLMACIDLLHARTTRLVRSASPSRRECHLYQTLWERLERFGIEPLYRQNSRKLKKLLADTDAE
jgi:hypothetical protein